MQDADFRRKLIATFRIEAAEHVQALTSGLLALEAPRSEDAPAAIVETVFRAAHSLKGAARAVGEARIEALCQEAESLFSALQRKELILSGELLDRLHQAVDAIAALVGAVGAEASRTGAATGPAERPSRPDTVRIAAARLEALLYRAEELLAAKLRAASHAAELRQLAKQMEAPGSRSPLTAAASAAEQHRRTLAAMVDGLLQDIKKSLMLPAGAMLEMFPKLARDLARSQGKDVELVLGGTDIEIDRRILEEMRDPLTHLVRNCIDHGIEAPEERRRKAKPAVAKVRIELRRRGEETIEILVADDGAGIDAGRLAEAALARGLASREEIEGKRPEELLPLVFRSGLSTSPLVTDLSGRGLGLAIVREKVERLGGSVLVETRRDEGTEFRMSLPLTLATFRGVHVRAGGARFLLPTHYVHEAVRVKRNGVETVAGRPTLRRQGRVIALVPLAAALGLPGEPWAWQGEHVTALIIGPDERRLALAVDEVLEEGEVLVKPLRKPLARLRTIAGAAVLGSGEPVPILDVPHLLDVAAGAVAPPIAAIAAAAKKPAALIAEDSITSRALLQNILESAGYEVATAVDGAEALALLGARSFDVVVSDVEMPRMDGFELTARIRADPGLSSVPVVLVTALDSASDRARGADVGASAYIVKSAFDHSNLLAVLRQLT